jgi:hypothetical protein
MLISRKKQAQEMAATGKLLHTQLSVKPIRPRCTLKPAKLNIRLMESSGSARPPPAATLNRMFQIAAVQENSPLLGGRAESCLICLFFGQFCFGQTGVSEKFDY